MMNDVHTLQAKIWRLENELAEAKQELKVVCNPFLKCKQCGMHCNKVHGRSQFKCGELGICQSAIDRILRRESQ